MHILVTHNDGVNAPGLLALNQALKMVTRMGLRIYYGTPRAARITGSAAKSPAACWRKTPTCGQWRTTISL
jgi:broad specificity polyphosphatase/5'/3'-nucleotidase SurE